MKHHTKFIRSQINDDGTTTMWTWDTTQNGIPQNSTMEIIPTTATKERQEEIIAIRARRRNPVSVTDKFEAQTSRKHSWLDKHRSEF